MPSYFKNSRFFRGGKELHTFISYRSKTHKNKDGIPITTPIMENPVAKFNGAISRASQKEVDYHKQLGHPITHEIIVYHPVPVRPGDVIALDERTFTVQSVRDPGELGIVFCIFTEEKKAIPKPQRHEEKGDGFFAW